MSLALTLPSSMFELFVEALLEVFVSLALLLSPPQLYTKYVPSAEILLTGSLPSGHDPEKLWDDKKDRIKSRNSFFKLKTTSVLFGCWKRATIDILCRVTSMFVSFFQPIFGFTFVFIKTTLSIKIGLSKFLFSLLKPK